MLVLSPNTCTIFLQVIKDMVDLVLCIKDAEAANLAMFLLQVPSNLKTLLQGSSVSPFLHLPAR